MKPFLNVQLCIRITAVLGFSGVAHGITFTDTATAWTDVVTGVPFSVTWADNSGAVALSLANGSFSNPHVVNNIQPQINSNAYNWTPGSFAIPGHTFFLLLNDSTGSEAFSPAFQVLAASATQSTASPSSSPTSSSSSSPTSPSTSSPTSTTPADNGSSSGLSTGAKAGIGIGVALGAVVIAAILGFLAYRHRKAKGKQPTTERGAGAGVAEMGATSGQTNRSGAPTGKDARGGYRLAEMDGTGAEGRHELL